MKTKLLIMMMLFSLISFPIFNNDYVDINHMLYVSSIGFNINQQQEIELNTYIINNYTMGKSEYNTGKNEQSKVILTKGKTIEDTIYNLLKTINVSVDFSHIESLVLHTSFCKKDLLTNLINYIKLNHKIYPSFSIYLTDVSLDSIYKLEYLSDNSSYFSVLSNYKSDIKLHKTMFLELVNDTLIDNYFCLYPSLTSKENIIGEKKGISLTVDGYFYLDDDIPNKLVFENDTFLNFLYSTKNIIFTINQETYNLVSYSIKHIKFLKKYYIFFYSKSTYDQKLKTIIKKYIINMYEKGIDFFNLKYYGIDTNNLYVISVEKNLINKKE